MASSKQNQLSILMKKIMLKDIDKGIKEADLVVKYNISKGAVGRVKRDRVKILSMNETSL